MRKIWLFAAVATVFAACTKNTEDATVITPASEKIHVTFADELSRVQLQEGVAVWNENDQLSVFNKTTGNGLWAFSGKDGAAEGDLVKLTDGEGGEATDKIVALYPYDKNATLEATTVSTTIPATQTYLKGSFGKDGSVIVAVSDDENLSFKNVLGWVKLSLTGSETVKQISLTGNNDEALNGAVKVDVETLTVETDADAGKTAVLDCGEGVELSATATDFYIAVVPQKFERGITITVETVDGSIFDKSTAGEIEVERNHILPLKESEIEIPECEISLVLGPVSELLPNYLSQYPDETSLVYGIFAGNSAKITKLNMALVSTSQIESLGYTDQEVMDILGDSQTDASSILDKFNSNGGYASIYYQLDPGTQYTFIVTATNEYGKSTIVSTKYSTKAEDISDYTGELVIGTYYMEYSSGTYTSTNTFTVTPVSGSTTDFVIKNLGLDQSTSWYAEYDPGTLKFTVSGIEVGYEDYGNQFGEIWGYANSARTQVLMFYSGEGGSDPCVFSVDPATKQICQLDTYFSTDVYSYPAGVYLGSYTEFVAGTPVTLLSAASASSASLQPHKLHKVESGAKIAASVKGSIADKKCTLKCAKSASKSIDAARLR